MKKYFITALAAIGMVSCGNYLTPDGEIVERDMEIPAGIEGIEVGDGIKLNISDDVPAGTAIVRTHFNIHPYIKAETSNGRIAFYVDARRHKDLDITITTSPDSYHNFTATGGSRIYSADPYTATSSAIILSGGSRATLAASCGSIAIDCSGGSELTFTGDSETADIICSGGSHCYANGFLTTKADIDISGGSVLSLTGECGTASIICSGGSHCLAYDFPTAKAVVDNSGGSVIELTITESITGENSGGSRISYKGTPSLLNVNNTGGSTTAPAK